MAGILFSSRLRLVRFAGVTLYMWSLCTTTIVSSPPRYARKLIDPTMHAHALIEAELPLRSS